MPTPETTDLSPKEEIPSLDASSSLDTTEADIPESLPEPLEPQPLEDLRALLRAGQRKRAVALLRISLPTYPNETQKNEARFLLGATLTEDDDPSGLPWLLELPAPYPILEDRRLFWLARAYVLQTDPSMHRPALLQTIDTLTERFPKTQGLEELRLARIQALYHSGKPNQAKKALAKLQVTPRALQARVLRQRADWIRTQDPKAVRALEKKLLLRFPEAPETRREGLSLSVEQLSDQERFTRALELMKRWSYQEARAELRRLLDHPKHGLDAAWNVAVISLRKLRDDPTEARKLLKRVLRSKRKKDHEEAWYLLMRSYMKQEKYNKALEVANEYDRRFPKGKYRERTDYYRGWLPYDRGQCQQAIPNLTRYINKHSAKRSLAMGFRAWCYIRTKRWKEALGAYRAMIPLGNPLVRGKAHYWRAYALYKLKDNRKAFEELDTLHNTYPLTYYDMLGQQLRATLQGEDPTASKLPWPEGGGEAHTHFTPDRTMWTWPRVPSAMQSRWARVQALVEHGEIDRARAEYKEIRKVIEQSVPTERRLPFIHFMGYQVEDFKRGWQRVTKGRLAAMTTMPNANDIRWQLAYPRAYEPLIERLATEFNLPSHFVYAIMRQESRYNPRAVSHTDAVGALQMIPPTAKRVAQEMGITYNPRTFPRPDVGFLYSFFYLHKHAKLFHEQLVLTAASYNSGPIPIARWMRENKEIPLAFLIEEFAYNEARNYCRKVAEHTLRYLYLYESDPKTRGKWLDALFPVDLNYTLPEDVDY